jgi:hypothetical protein
MERVMRRFYLRGLVEESMGTETDWKMADSAFVQAASIARDVAKYRHAALSAVRLAGDLNFLRVPAAGSDAWAAPRRAGARPAALPQRWPMRRLPRTGDRPFTREVYQQRPLGRR